MEMLKNNYIGKLIVFEGTDGSGKTTLLNQTKKILEQQNIECYATKMPSQRVRNIDIFNEYDKSNDDTIRNTVDLENLTIFVSGDRLLVQDLEIIPALKHGKIVLCDRYCFTSLARCNTPLIKKLANRFIKPDITIYAYAPFEIVKSRVKSRINEKNDFFDEKDVKNQIKIFNKLAKENNFETVDTTKEVDIKTILTKYKII